MIVVVFSVVVPIVRARGGAAGVDADVVAAAVDERLQVGAASASASGGVPVVVAMVEPGLMNAVKLSCHELAAARSVDVTGTISGVSREPAA